MIYWRRYGADYLVSTIGFSMEMDGAYGRLLDYYYSTELPLTLDRDELMRIARASKPSEQEAVDQVIARKFKRRADGYHHDRSDAEIRLAQQARDNGGKHVGKSAKDSDTTTDTATGEVTRKRSGRGIGKPTQKNTEKPTETPSQIRHESTVNPQPLSRQPSAVSFQPSTGGAKPPELGTSRPRRGASPPVPDEHQGNGKALAEPPLETIEEIPEGHGPRFASDAEISWWHSPAGIQAMGLEHRMQLGADEDWREYAARVMAAVGPGPWDQEQPPEQRERIEHFRTARGA